MNSMQKQHPVGGLALVVAALVTLPGLTAASGAPASAPDKELTVEVLSVSVSKLGRDAFGNAVSEFSGMPFSQGEGGTVVLAKITPRGTAALKLLEEKCRLLSFEDNTGKVLFTNATTELGNSFFAANRSLEILTARDPGYFGVKVRSARLPAPAANRLRAEVRLVFGLSSEERIEQQTGVVLQTNEVVSVGPVRALFTIEPPVTSRGTNQPATNLNPTLWQVRMRPEKEAAIVSVTFFSKQSDEPILVVKNLTGDGSAASSSVGNYDRRPIRGAQDSFSNCMGYLFRPPEDRTVSIKVRYYEVGSLVEKNCVISTGLSP